MSGIIETVTDLLIFAGLTTLAAVTAAATWEVIERKRQRQRHREALEHWQRVSQFIEEREPAPPEAVEATEFRKLLAGPRG